MSLAVFFLFFCFYSFQVSKNGLTSSIFTLYELANGDDTENEGSLAACWFVLAGLVGELPHPSLEARLSHWLLVLPLALSLHWLRNVAVILVLPLKKLVLVFFSVQQVIERWGEAIVHQFQIRLHVNSCTFKID